MKKFLSNTYYLILYYRMCICLKKLKYTIRIFLFHFFISLQLLFIPPPTLLLTFFPM